ncbi:hypothetical protein KVR01_004547 [Diaporthe batatas]|uniref:uncharacterized protein n=1 Tax=Diaporthe batatas TaxID=748121 RepID=UPI001D03C43B|nr:uncharacterized protein KVR01_004547 [Diaporthe batatas]KAG8165995.1 hypothetical protein KVR01_004547 [Diaporthe batatas]
MNNSSASQSATNVAKETPTQKTPAPQMTTNMAGATAAQTKEASGTTVRQVTVRKIAPEDLGIKIRYQPENEDDIDIDILAVPGIGTNPESTWTYYEPDPQDPQDKSKVSRVKWLSDDTMLPSLFPNARIMTFGYDSFWFGDAPPKQRLGGIATEVLMDLCEQRKDCDRRPILLIGHCYGGLVMQQMYLQSRRRSSEYPSIYDSITGMVFLGTPHYGSSISNMASLGDIYETIRQQNLQTDDSLLKTIAHDNTVLVETVDDFVVDVKQQAPGPEIFCFFEKRPTQIGVIANLDDKLPEFVVNESSACLVGYRRVGLTTDHFNMNKFSSNKNDNYKKVVRELKKMGEKSEDLMKQRRAAMHGSISGNFNQQTDSQAHKSIPMLPFSVAKGFAPRDGILEKIQSHFEHSSKVVLVGACGSGKTHVAVEYADRFHKQNPEAKIYCVNASNAADFELSYYAINDKLKLKSGRKGNVMGAVRDYMAQGESGEWLMIVDGLDQDKSIGDTDKPTANPHGNDPDSLQSILDYIPDGHTYGGQVLVTTRSKRMATRVISQHKYIVELSKNLTKDDALQLLLSGSKMKASSSMKYQPKIVDALQGSAGALALVRAYKETFGPDFSWKDLCDVIQTSIKDNIENQTQANDHIRHVLGIWKPLYAQLRAKHNEAAELLHILCRLDVQSIPVFLIDTRFDDKSEREKHTKALKKHDMLEISVNKRDARVTPMIRLLANSMVSSQSDDAGFLDEAALGLVTNAFPSHETEDNIKCRALKPCAFAALRLAVESPEANHKKAQLLFRLGAYERRVGNRDSAMKLLEQCIELCRKGEKRSEGTRKLEKDARKLLESTQKDHGKAQRRRSREKDGSPPAGHRDDSPGTKAITISPKSKADDVRSMSNSVLGAHRRVDCTEDNVKSLKQIVDWCRANYGPQHRDTVRQQFNLALALDANGEHAEADKLYLETVKIMETTHGSGGLNADLLRMQNDLARRSAEQGRYKDAEALWLKVLQDQTESLSRNHPDALLTRMNLALVAQELRPGDLESPAAELQSVLATQTRLLGDRHPATLRTASNLAQNFGLRGRITDAGPLFKLCLEIQTASLGEKHPDTMRTLAMKKELESETVPVC